MKYRLIASDYDFTMANTPKMATERTKKTILEYRRRGGLFTVVTGRMTRGILARLDEIETDLPISSYQGAVIFDRYKGEIVKDWNIPTANAVMLLDEFEKNGYEYNTYINDMLWLPREYRGTADYSAANKIEFHISPDLRTFILKNKFTLPKMLITLPPEKAKELEIYYADKYKNIFTVTRSSPVYLEFTDKSASKGNAVKWLAEKYGIDQSEIMCFGDSTNDISMIEYAGLGVAVGNAMDEVKERADLIADTCENEGLAKVIEEYCL